MKITLNTYVSPELGLKYSNICMSLVVLLVLYIFLLYEKIEDLYILQQRMSIRIRE